MVALPYVFVFLRFPIFVFLLWWSGLCLFLVCAGVGGWKCWLEEEQGEGESSGGLRGVGGAHRIFRLSNIDQPTNK